ncbi:MAG: hypothetical protein FRX49_09000 [Trebouxia sp. A1-2]|nr:MAG: hypothetical protein FRX49_09000 [Trebouxia sp. A1-2]
MSDFLQQSYIDYEKGLHLSEKHRGSVAQKIGWPADVREIDSGASKDGDNISAEHSRQLLIPVRENTGKATQDMPGQGIAGNSRAGWGKTYPKP